MGLESLGRLPGQKKLMVGSAPGPTSYARGVGIAVRVDVGVITKISDIVSVWLQGPPHYAPSISGYAGNTVYVLLGYSRGAAGPFWEVSALADVSDVSAFVAAMGR